MKKIFLLFSTLMVIQVWAKNDTPIICGAEQLEKYLPLIKNKKLGMVVNKTSLVYKTHLVDTLLKLGIQIKFIFSPEHGFRNNASNGELVKDDFDTANRIPIISLYGKQKKPTKEQMAEIDLMIFDIQDVGCRFYTYINNLRDIMEACAEYQKPLIVLDRPNPNDYVDGPILEKELFSGIGQFPIPIVYGLTIGEFALMINGEGWLRNNLQANLTIIKLNHYYHGKPYILAISPSPNLNTQQAIELYPTLCLFEGTAISQGRGTYFPFTVLGSPNLKGKYKFHFKPVSIKGMKENPLYENEICYGIDLRKYKLTKLRKSKKINLTWLIELYKAFPQKDIFFDKSQHKEIGDFDKLAGTKNLKIQITENKSISEIRASWESGLSNYKEKYKKYWLYL